jgi:hypothetical protein
MEAVTSQNNENKSKWWESEKAAAFVSQIKERCTGTESPNACWNLPRPHPRFNNDDGRRIYYIPGRFLWEFVNKTSPAKNFLYTLCDTIACANPAHFTTSREEHLFQLWTRCSAERNVKNCLLWKGHVQRGYGISDGIPVHHVGYCIRAGISLEQLKEQLQGQVDGAKKSIRHSAVCCKNCFEPTHLDIGTAVDQGQDNVDHGRTPNGENHGKSKLTNEQAVTIFKNEANESDYVLASRYGVTHSTVQAIRTGISWSAVTGATGNKRKWVTHLPPDDVLQQIASSPELQQKVMTWVKSHTAVHEEINSSCWLPYSLGRSAPVCLCLVSQWDPQGLHTLPTTVRQYPKEHRTQTIFL